jgi:hypothetical protein
MYDYLVTNAMDDESLPDEITPEIWEHYDKMAAESFKTLKNEFLNGIRQNVPVVGVSTGNALLAQRLKTMTLVYLEPVYPRSSRTISELIQVTDQEIRSHLGSKSRAEPAPLAFAVAQRGDRTTTIDATIE